MRHYSRPEVDHGARTLAAIVPPGPRGRPGLLSEVRLLPAVGAGRRAPLGGPARPAPVVGLLWRAVEDRLRAAGDPALVAFVDGKPLLVGGCSKDPDAAFGRAAGHVGRGYKLHAVWSTRAVPEAWEVTPLNACEKAAARRLVARLGHGGYLLADGN